MATVFPLPTDLAAIRTCRICRSWFVPNNWNAFDGTCDACYPDRSFFDLPYWWVFGPRTPAQQKAYDTIRKYRGLYGIPKDFGDDRT